MLQAAKKRKAEEPPPAAEDESSDDDAAGDESGDESDGEGSDIEAGGERLIPAELLSDDGVAYLKGFKPIKMKDTRKEGQVQTVDQVRLSRTPPLARCCVP